VPVPGVVVVVAAGVPVPGVVVVVVAPVAPVAAQLLSLKHGNLLSKTISCDSLGVQLQQTKTK